MLTRRGTATTTTTTSGGGFKSSAVDHRRRHAYDDSSDTESVATLRAFEQNEDDSDYEEKVGLERHRQTVTKRLASQNHAYIGRAASTANTTQVTRLPTRRPDPNVCNRNALMARENRKRKKEQMEQLEHENENLQRDLKKLQKVVYRQEVMIRGLRNERNYLKSVLENQSTIVTLLKRLQPQKEQEQEKPPKKEEHFKSSPNSIYSDSGMSLCGENSPAPHGDFDLDLQSDDNAPPSHGTALGGEFDNFFDETLLNAAFPLISTDVMFSPGSAAEAVDLLNFDFDLRQQEEEEEGGNFLSGENVRTEHNYVYSDITRIPYDNEDAVVVVKNPVVDDEEEEEICPSKRPRLQSNTAGGAATPGICLHIGGGKVSLEFCAQCQANANKQWHVKRL